MLKETCEIKWMKLHGISLCLRKWRRPPWYRFCEVTPEANLHKRDWWTRTFKNNSVACLKWEMVSRKPFQQLLLADVFLVLLVMCNHDLRECLRSLSMKNRADHQHAHIYCLRPHWNCNQSSFHTLPTRRACRSSHFPRQKWTRHLKISFAFRVGHWDIVTQTELKIWNIQHKQIHVFLIAHADNEGSWCFERRLKRCWINSVIKFHLFLESLQEPNFRGKWARTTAQQ